VLSTKHHSERGGTYNDPDYDLIMHNTEHRQFALRSGSATPSVLTNAYRIAALENALNASDKVEYSFQVIILDCLFDDGSSLP
jgi:hypothetical protein